jgi:hypothetical protein
MKKWIRQGLVGEGMVELHCLLWEGHPPNFHVLSNLDTHQITFKNIYRACFPAPLFPFPYNEIRG